MGACDVIASTQDAKTAVGAGDPAADVGTQSSLRNVVVAASMLFASSSSYDGATASAVAQVDPGFCLVNSTTPSLAAGGSCEAGGGSQPISIYSSGQTFAAAAMSSSGTCFWIHAERGTISGYGSGEPCTGSAATAATGSAFPS